jgi:hypothetical protein
MLPVLLTSALVFIALNLLIGAWSHRLPYYHKLNAIQTAPNPNLLFIGNSLLDGHVDEPAFVRAAQGAGFRPLNAALGASLHPEHLLLFDYAVRMHTGIHTLVVGILDFQLTELDHSHAGDLTGNRMLGIDPRFPIAEVSSAYGFGRLDRFEVRTLRRFPMIANRANAWKDVELLRRAMGSMGMPVTALNSMGRVDDFSALEAGSDAIFDAQARTFLEHPDHFNPSYESMFVQARSAGMNVAIVVMPASPTHRERFYNRPVWRQYLAAVTRLASQRGIRVIDASIWMPYDRDFEDHLHMTQLAAHDFSIRLGSDLAALR